MSDVTCGSGECPGRDLCKNRAKIPGIRRGETCEEANERKWIAYRLRNRSSSVTPAERSAITLFFALDGGSRIPLDQVARQLGGTRAAMARTIRAALKKILWHTPVKDLAGE